VKKRNERTKKGGDDDVVMLSCFSVREQFLCGGETKNCAGPPNQFHGLCQAISAETGKSRQMVA
jgi:hypothetical protein